MTNEYTVTWGSYTDSDEFDSAEEAALWFASAYANPDNGFAQRMHLVVTKGDERTEFDVEAKIVVRIIP